MVSFFIAIIASGLLLIRVSYLVAIGFIVRRMREFVSHHNKQLLYSVLLDNVWISGRSYFSTCSGSVRIKDLKY